MYEDPQPRLFSFNNPFGACPTCHGFGNIIELDMDLVVPDPSKSIQQGAIDPWSKPHYRAQLADLKRVARRHKIRLEAPWADLTLDRVASALSSGEAQRMNLATSLGSALVGTLYVLDEPSIGLHSRDNLRLIAILRQLRDQGNTVLVVEHDADMIKVADHIVDLGLGAGEQGGRVVFSGALDGLMQDLRSLT